MSLGIMCAIPQEASRLAGAVRMIHHAEHRVPHGIEVHVAHGNEGFSARADDIADLAGLGLRLHHESRAWAAGTIGNGGHRHRHLQRRGFRDALADGQIRKIVIRRCTPRQRACRGFQRQHGRLAEARW